MGLLGDLGEAAADGGNGGGRRVVGMVVDRERKVWSLQSLLWN